MIGIFSRGIINIPHIEVFLDSAICQMTPLNSSIKTLQGIAVWGYRPSAKKPTKYAMKHQLPVIRLEDGFIRSVGLGVDGESPLSIVIDHHSIYYDANQPSELELMIQDVALNTPHYPAAEKSIEFICQHNLSKYNHAPEFTENIQSSKPKVLILDQTLNDMGIQYGNADSASFKAMLDAAMVENPNHEIWLKTHPDVLTGKKQGYFTNVMIDYPQIRCITDNVSPLSLLKHVEKVYTVTSQMGFEALLLGKQVITFGQPWYAGWGLTDDRHPHAERLSTRRGTSTLLNLFSAAYFRYCRYINPATGQIGHLFDVMKYIVLVKQHRISRAGSLCAPGLSLWKKTILHSYLKTPSNRVSFKQPNTDSTACVVWGTRGEKRWKSQCELLDIPIWRMEDGFLRSVGLGSDLNMPLSLVLDKTGIYYDSSRASDLENILNTLTLSTSERERAVSLRKYIVESKLSKYNVGNAFTLNLQEINQRVILVPGQVEDDASILTGSPMIQSNETLLASVRTENPDAFIIYKPHPDVLSGNRKGHISAERMTRLADMVATDADIIDCITVADEVHTMTSLSGFEALLHGKKVTCYGQPFYSGWGLTIDKIQNSRRVNRLTINELLFGAYALYPTYIHPKSLRVISVEEAIYWLKSKPRKQSMLLNSKFGWIQRQFRKLFFLAKTLIK